MIHGQVRNGLVRALVLNRILNKVERVLFDKKEKKKKETQR